MEKNPFEHPDELHHSYFFFYFFRYHPVHIGDLYAERYLVIGRLGAGAFSTVWLVADLNRDGRLQALKVCKSKKTVVEQAEDEIRIMLALTRGPTLREYDMRCVEANAPGAKRDRRANAHDFPIISNEKLLELERPVDTWYERTQGRGRRIHCHDFCIFT